MIYLKINLGETDMDIRTILSAVAKAYLDFKKAFSMEKNSDQLFEAFSLSLKESLGDYQTVYDYAWGKDALNIDGISKAYMPKKGDTLIMDISVGKDGVWCDVCRTFFVQEVTCEQRQIFELIKKSVRAGHSALKAGVKACDIYEAVNGVYQKEGKVLVHHAGHKIGSEPLMQPQFLEENKTQIENGQTYTIESGLYDGFGIRLENDYLVKNGGAEDLFEELLPLEIEEYILR